MTVGVGVTVRVEGIDKLTRDFAPERIEGALSRMVDDVTHIVETRMAVYPPEGDYNRPGPYPKRWYQRLVGPRWALKAGGYGGRNTSEKLQQSFKTDRLSQLSRQVYTDVTYAPHVMAAEEQVSWAPEHGWRTDEQIAPHASTVAIGQRSSRVA